MTSSHNLTICSVKSSWLDKVQGITAHLRFPSSVIATSSSCILLGINLCQPPIRVTATRAKLRVWRPRPSSAEAFLALAWQENVSPICSTPRWMLWFTHNLLTMHHADGKCTWHVAQGLALSALYLVREVSSQLTLGYPFVRYNPKSFWGSESVNQRSFVKTLMRPTQNCNDAFVPFEQQAYWFII